MPCSIDLLLTEQVLTILAGCVKLVFEHYRVKKYASLPQHKGDLNREKSIIRSLSRRSGKTPMAQRRPPKLIKDGVDVPFGIRAIESGIEVDGVWISRSTTPLTLPNSRQSSANSFYGISANNSTANVSAVNVSYKVDPMSALPNQSLMATSRPTSRLMDRSWSDSIVGIPAVSEMSQPTVVRYPPHSYSRYENTRHFRKSRTASLSDNSSRPVSSYGKY